MDLSKPGMPLNEPQTEAGRALLADMRRDESVLAGMAVSPGIRFGPQFFEALESAILAIEREARGIPLIDVELLARALAILRTSKAIENVWWTAEVYPKASLTEYGFADRIIEEYTRLAGIPVEEGER